MKRRDFLRTAAVTGIAGAIKLGGADKLTAQPSKTSAGYDMIAVMNGTPEAMFQRAISEIGGMDKFIKKGDKLVVKPNIGWDKSPEFAANTNPDLIKAIIKSCLDAGAKEVVVFDHTCDDWKLCYKNSGIEDAVKAAGGKMAYAHEEKYYRKINLPKGQRLKETLIHEAILDCDAWINVPILKTHGGAKMTIAMKNYMGIVWDRRFWHSNDLQQCIADCSTYAKKPVLNIVDAYRVMKSNGPKGRSESDVVMGNALFMSPDIVAIDTAAVKFFAQIEKMELDDVSHIAKAQKLKTGTMDLDALNIKRVRL
ncbi:MAG: DUF362 domain-containing protein [Prevotellaceae bacterium]|jgi:uncharacterized protein (DUF362 family)|nr:DUF362 domain-containing protein [Prevotellaceae bacterium]